MKNKFTTILGIRLVLALSSLIKLVVSPLFICLGQLAGLVLPFYIIYKLTLPILCILLISHFVIWFILLKPFHSFWKEAHLEYSKFHQELKDEFKEFRSKNKKGS